MLPIPVILALCIPLGIVLLCELLGMRYIPTAP